jgi:hypothetical protein
MKTYAFYRSLFITGRLWSSINQELAKRIYQSCLANNYSVKGCYEHGSEYLGSIKDGKFLP